MKILCAGLCSVLAFCAGLVVSPYATDYLDLTMSDEYKTTVDIKIASWDPKLGDKFLLGHTVIGSTPHYVFYNIQRGNLEYVDKDTVFIIEDSVSYPRYMDCSAISVCDYGDGKGRKLIVPVGYELKFLKMDIKLAEVDW